ncbi:MAG: hypothetical protein AB8B84_18345 [Granulosicoccus sp.]
MKHDLQLTAVSSPLMVLKAYEFEQIGVISQREIAQITPLQQKCRPANEIPLGFVTGYSVTDRLPESSDTRYD